MEQNDKIKIIRPNKGGQTRFVRSNVDVCFFGGTLAGGKLLSVNERVLTPLGWVRNGDLKPGDVVNTPFGKPTRVLAVFPHKDKPIYTLRTSDGRECLCGLEHLWEARTREQFRKYLRHHRNEDFSVLTTQQIIDRIKSGEELLIPIPDAQELTERKYAVSPYEYGKSLRKGERVRDEYKLGSIGQREELIGGLLDNPGDILQIAEGSELTSFICDTEAMRDDLTEILRSLGMTVYCGADYDGLYVLDCPPDDHVRIESVTYRCNEDALCILVEDSDHLYIAGDFLTTHNTFGAVMSMAEASMDPRFRGCFVRRTLGDLKVAGGVVDKFEEVYGSDNLDIRKSDSPLIRFPSGATVECRQIQNEDRQKVIETWKGSEYDVIAFEELTGFSWETFTYLMSRNRGKSAYAGHVIATTNPKKSHWVRRFISAYINDEGYIDPKMDGVVRYFFINGESVEDTVWGNTRHEVYMRCKGEIDDLVSSSKTKVSPYDFIKSFCFYLGRTSENVKLLENNPGYLGSVAATGAKQKKILLEGNWDVDEDGDNGEAEIKPEDARHVLSNDECRNGSMWITADLADVGKDNSVVLAWDGFHLFDILVIPKCLPKENADWILGFAMKHRIPDSHIIYDATRALYINDYIRDAIPYVSSRSPMGLISRSVRYLKDECYKRLSYVIENRMMSISESVANKVYRPQKKNSVITVGMEFLDECAVVRFDRLPNGKLCLLGKKELNRRLGKNRSMDLLDPVAMRMLPVLGYQVGEELERTAADADSDYEKETGSPGEFDIYDESNWC